MELDYLDIFFLQYMNGARLLIIVFFGRLCVSTLFLFVELPFLIIYYFFNDRI